jgi:aspartyl-tRNA(Asn)/glutamyl-tRNA(Gln) amidotransferase subunit A
MTERSLALEQWSILTLSRAIRERRITCQTVTAAAIERAKRDTTNSFIALNAEQAIRNAVRLDKELANGRCRGSLHGVPLAHKDMFYRQGDISTGGSQIRKEWVAQSTATVIARLDEAGAVDLGRLNMSEFAAGPTGHNRTFGNALNVHNNLHVAGGSSSGSAVAVAGKIVYGTLGSDTGGSIRIPAAFNGLFGLKPTYGTVSRSGAMARSWSLDHIGPLARSAVDCALIYAHIAGEDPRDSTTFRAPIPQLSDDWPTRLDGIRIGLTADMESEGISEEVARSVKEAAAVLRSLGAEILAIPSHDFSTAFNIAETIVKCEAAAMHGPWMAERPLDYAPHVRSRIEAGFFIPATAYIDALRLRQGLLEDFLVTSLRGVDFYLGPTTGKVAPLISESDLDDSGPAVIALVSKLTRLTRPFNLLGLPALSVPCAVRSNGLPVGFQLVGRPFDDMRLISVANAYEAARLQAPAAP